MENSTKPFFRAEHVGSLLRPGKLKDARDRLEGDHHARVRGSRRFRELESMENECILEAVKLQEAAGLKVLTDGEFRRRSWWQDFALELEGTFIDFGDHGLVFRDPQGHKLPVPVGFVDGKIRRVRGFNTDCFEFLKKHTQLTPKVTMPAPHALHFFGGRACINSSIYPDLEEFWSDLARAYQEEIADLAHLGCRYVQLDDAMFATMCDPTVQEQLRARGDDPQALLADYVKVVNAAISGRPADMTVAIHLCRGNNRGHWMASGGYDFVAEALFGELQVDSYLLEYDSPRAGDFSPLSKLPNGKTVILGLISSKTAVLESKDELKRRIDEAGRYASLSQLGISPQCGFSSHFLGNPLSQDDQMRKLELVVGIAQDVWGQT
ncbi:MAG: 5-methyltetrahydropteroyltriglutamate--homocysteine S-methyltransferase [Betaproteobacteria bacterium]|nr:5-methyltetrahydropteroyltriglutamate--homocysteine S-methyltransferase [Betaproteobacteria bacterium]